MYQSRKQAYYQSSPMGTGGDYQGGGERSSGRPAPGSRTRESPGGRDTIGSGGQSYAEIQDECRRQGKLWEDPDFPANDLSCYTSRRPPKSFVWKRPAELSKNPQMFVDGASRFDINQGQLGNCWLLASVACLCENAEILHRVVPAGQTLSARGGYCGVIRFRFWRFGEWIEVLVDDRLPTYNGKLVFLNSKDPDEFWSALLEKAYAKLFGSYEALRGGNSSEAMEDFTGGLTEMYNFHENLPENLFQIMLKAHDKGGLICAAVETEGGGEVELGNGLVAGHAYSVTDVMQVQTRRLGVMSMLRIRNPWGNEQEWNGDWSDNSPLWKQLTTAEKQSMNPDFKDDGEFWMSYPDFLRNFTKVEICNLGPESVVPEKYIRARRWEATVHHGSWVRKVSAGGCRNFIDTFWTNPQYHIEVVDPDDEDDDDMGTLLVALMQKDKGKVRKTADTMATIGYTIYKLKDTKFTGPLEKRFFKKNRAFVKSYTFLNSREICERHKVPPGDYVIIPSTFDPNEESDFLLRIFTEKPAHSEEMNEQTSVEEQPAPIVNNNHIQSSGNNGYPETDQKQKVVDDKKMRHAYQKIAGPDGMIESSELQQILNARYRKEFQFDGFTNDCCRGLLAMMDVDMSGYIEFEEFKVLIAELNNWVGVFREHDADKSGKFDSHELRGALHSLGYKVSNNTLKAIALRYSREDGTIHFDDYIHCVMRLRSMFGLFNKHRSGKEATFDIDMFLQTTMYS